MWWIPESFWLIKAPGPLPGGMNAVFHLKGLGPGSKAHHKGSMGHFDMVFIFFFTSHVTIIIISSITPPPA